jgi:hypothetical protein
VPEQLLVFEAADRSGRLHVPKPGELVAVLAPLVPLPLPLPPPLPLSLPPQQACSGGGAGAGAGEWEREGGGEEEEEEEGGRRLECLFLNCCNSAALAAEIKRALPRLRVVFWSTLVEDGAARAFARGLFDAVGEALRARPPRQCGIGEAFARGRQEFARAGYVEGDPERFLHPPGHPHTTAAAPPPVGCAGCRPPVHGQPVLL